MNPIWETSWVVANVPSSGFDLKCRLYDEDPADADDRLGNVHVRADWIDVGWPGIKEREYRVKKRMGSKRAYLLRAITEIGSKTPDMSGYLVMSVECLGKTPGNQGAHIYTVGPNYWTKHLSPLIGMLAGVKDEGQGEKVGSYKYVLFQFFLNVYLFLVSNCELQLPSHSASAFGARATRSLPSICRVQAFCRGHVYFP